MSSSSDIEKLFDHFGGDASAYQEIGRENEARSARTRWPLLVTLDLTQPAIPAIGQRREVAGEALAQEAAPEVDRQDMTPQRRCLGHAREGAAVYPLASTGHSAGRRRRSAWRTARRFTFRRVRNEG